MTREGTTAESVSQMASAISQKVWVLAQMRGYKRQLDLANALGWSRPKLTRLLSGEYEWTLTNLAAVATVLGLDSPGDLFQPLAELVGAASVRDDRGRTIEGTSGWKYAGSSGSDGALAKVLPLRPDYQTDVPRPGRADAPFTRSGAGPLGGHAHSA